MATLWSGNTITSATPAIYAECTYNYWREGNNMVYQVTSSMWITSSGGWRNDKWSNRLWFNGSADGNIYWSNQTIKPKTSGAIGTAKKSATTGYMYVAKNSGGTYLQISYANNNNDYWGGTIWTTLSGYMETVGPSGPNTVGTPSISATSLKPGDNITLSWSNPGGGSNGVNGYRVAVSVNGGAWSYFTTSSTSYTTTPSGWGVGHGGNIKFAVMAYTIVNGVEYGGGYGYSGTAYVSVPAPYMTSFTLSGKGQTSIKVVASGGANSGLSLSGYQFSKDGGSTWTSTQSSGTYEFTGLSTYTTYNLRARTVDSAGQVSGASALTVKTDPTLPVVSGFSSSNITSSQVQLNVTATAQAGIANYQFSKDDGATWTTAQTGASYTFTGLSSYTEYKFKVRVKDVEGFYTDGSLTKRTLATTPSISGTEILEITDEMFTIKATAVVPSVTITKMEFRLNTTGSWQNADTLVGLNGTKTYIDLMEEKVYNVFIRVTNSEGTVSNEYKVDVTTLPGKFATVIKENETPKKIHTYLIRPDGSKKKLTKRTFKIIKG